MILCVPKPEQFEKYRSVRNDSADLWNLGRFLLDRRGMLASNDTDQLEGIETSYPLNLSFAHSVTIRALLRDGTQAHTEMSAQKN
jgi:hypothetical protein